MHRLFNEYNINTAFIIFGIGVDKQTSYKYYLLLFVHDTVRVSLKYDYWNKCRIYYSYLIF